MTASSKVVVVGKRGLEGTAKRRNELMVAPYRLSLQAQRLFLYMVSLVADDHDENTPYEFSVYQLASEIGVDRTHLYHSMVGVLDELERTKVVVPDPDAPGSFRRLGLIQNRQGATREWRDGKFLVDGKLQLFVFKELLPYIRQLKANYTEVELRYVFRLASSYSQKIYDVLKSQAFKGKPFLIGVEDFYDMMQVPTSLRRFQDFRRNVLEKAQVEINEKTDLRFDWEPKRRGRRIEAIVFTVSRQGGGDVEFLAGGRDDALYKKLRAAGLSMKEAAEAVRQWGTSDAERITWHIEHMKGAKKPLAWLRAGLKKDYRPQMRMPFAERQAEKAELDRERALRRRSSSEGSKGPQPIGELLKTDNPVLAAALQRMAAGIEKKVKDQ